MFKKVSFLFLGVVFLSGSYLMASQTAGDGINHGNLGDMPVSIDQTEDPSVTMDQTEEDPAVMDKTEMDQTTDPSVEVDHTEDPSVTMDKTEDPSVTMDQTEDPSVTVDYSGDQSDQMTGNNSSNEAYASSPNQDGTLVSEVDSSQDPSEFSDQAEEQPGISELDENPEVLPNQFEEQEIQPSESEEPLGHSFGNEKAEPVLPAGKKDVKVREFTEESAVGAAVYNLADHLREGDAYLVRKTAMNTEDEDTGAGERKMGRWEKDRFIFPDNESEPPISILVQKYKGREEKAIFFQPTEGFIKILRIYQVPPGSRMILYYGIDDVGAAVKDKTVVYFNVWIGQHKIARLQIPNKKGWKKAEIDLGVLAFLKRSVNVTFEAVSDNTKGGRFSFNAEIYP